MSDKSVCRTAPTTPGLLNIVFMYGSKDFKSRSTSKLHDQIKSYTNFNDIFCPWLIWVFWIWNQSTVDNIGVSRGRSVAVGISDMWKVTCDWWKVTCDMWHVTCDLWHVTSDKCQKVSEFFFNWRRKKSQKVPRSFNIFRQLFLKNFKLS